MFVVQERKLHNQENASERVGTSRKHVIEFGRLQGFHSRERKHPRSTSVREKWPVLLTEDPENLRPLSLVFLEA